MVWWKILEKATRKIMEPEIANVEGYYVERLMEKFNIDYHEADDLFINDKEYWKSIVDEKIELPSGGHPELREKVWTI